MTAQSDAVQPVAKSSADLLSASHLTAGYKADPVVHDVDVAFQAGSITALVGSNGAGKSTLLKALFGLVRIFSGTIAIDGHDLRPNARDLVTRGIAYVPQVANVFPSLTVKENLEVGTYVRRGGSPDNAVALFPALQHLLARPAHKLSGGERNMVAVGRALASQPRLLLLDEATGGLAPALAEDFWEHIAGLAAAGIAIVAVEQNVDLALLHAHRVYVLAGGRIAASGTASEVKVRPDLQDLFLLDHRAATRTGAH